ncbi:hypothetical protein AALA00_09485 [Lachnospiraceae bacterium 46-15]
MRKKIALLLISLLAVSNMNVLAANKNFSFTFRDNSSIPSALGRAKKGADGDKFAYITPQIVTMNNVTSNMTITNAKINTRVRTNDAQHATFLCPLQYGYGRYTVQYQSGRAVSNAYYLLYGNVESASKYPVYLNGVWCP